MGWPKYFTYLSILVILWLFITSAVAPWWINFLAGTIVGIIILSLDKYLPWFGDSDDS